MAILFLAYMAVGYWATGKTLYRNKVVIEYKMGDLFVQRMIYGTVLGWILIPVAAFRYFRENSSAGLGAILKGIFPIVMICIVGVIILALIFGREGTDKKSKTNVKESGVEAEADHPQEQGSEYQNDEADSAYPSNEPENDTVTSIPYSQTDHGTEVIQGVKEFVAPGMGYTVESLMADAAGSDLEWSYEKTDAEYVIAKFKEPSYNAECEVIFLAEKMVTEYKASLYAVRNNGAFDQNLYDSLNYEVFGIGSGSTEYILPDSSTQRLTANDLAGLTQQELRLARNEIYARHGRKFQDSEMQAYFDSKAWYQGTVEASDFSEDMLSQIEKDNIALIQSLE